MEEGAPNFQDEPAGNRWGPSIFQGFFSTAPSQLKGLMLMFSCSGGHTRRICHDSMCPTSQDSAAALKTDSPGETKVAAPVPAE